MKMNKGMVFLLVVILGGLSYFASTLRRQVQPTDWSDKTPPSNAAIDSIKDAVKTRLGVNCHGFGYKMSESIFRSKNTRLTCEAEDARFDGEGLDTFGREVAKVMAQSVSAELDVIEVCVARTDTVAGVKITGKQVCFQVDELLPDAGT